VKQHDSKNTTLYKTKESNRMCFKLTAALLATYINAKRSY